MSNSYKKTVIQLEVLSTGDFEWDNLLDLARRISDGDCDYQCEVLDVKWLTGKQYRAERRKMHEKEE